MKKFSLVIVFIVLSGASAFAKPTVYPSLNFGLPVELWSAGAGTAVKYSDVSIAGGIKAKVFFENNLGVFVDLGVGTMVSRTIDGRNLTNLKDFNPFAFYAAVGAAYRLPLGGPITLSIGAGPSYTLQSTSVERPAGVRIVVVNFGGVAVRRSVTVPASKITNTLHTFGLVLEPALIVAFGPNLFLDAGVNLGFNFIRELSIKSDVGSASATTSRAFKKYFGVAITPYIGLGYSF